LVRIVKVEPQSNDYFEELETGSGFFIDNNGTIATNSHVVEKIIIGLSGKIKNILFKF